MKYLAFLSPLLLASCVTTDTVPSGKKPPEVTPKATIVLGAKNAVWDDMDDVREAMKGKPVIIKGTTLDLKGALVSGKKLKRYDDPNDERSQPILITIPKFTFRNGYLKDVPGGVVVKADNVTLENLISLNVGEDAFSSVVDKAANLTVRNCKAYGANDKSFQWNDARGLTFSHNYATGGITAVRIQKTDTKFKGIKTKELKNNTFEDVQTGWNVSGGATAVATGTKYLNVEKKSVTSNGGEFTEK